MPPRSKLGTITSQANSGGGSPLEECLKMAKQEIRIFDEKTQERQKDLVVECTNDWVAFCQEQHEMTVALLEDLAALNDALGEASHSGVVDGVSDVINADMAPSYEAYLQQLEPLVRGIQDAGKSNRAGPTT